MDPLNSLFYGVGVEEVVGLPVDEMSLSTLDGRGNLLKISALDPCWPLLTLKSQYVKYPGSSKSDLLSLWRRSAQTYCDELHNLTLETTYDRFWCHVIYQPRRVLDFLRSFTTKACRSYDLQKMNKEDEAVHGRIAGLSFLAFITISCNRRTTAEYISEKKHGEILQEFIKIAFLMDICALFGGNSQTEGMLRSAIAQCFEKNRRLYTELRIALRDIGQSLFQSMEDRLSESEEDMSVKPVSQLASKDIVDVVGYICDILSTLQRIISIASPPVQAVIRQAKFASRLAQFGEKVVWILNREVVERLEDGGADEVEALRHAAHQGNIMEWALVHAFRRLECWALLEDRPSAPDVASSLSKLLETLPHHQLFTIMYEKWAPVKKDVLLARSLQANVEESVVDFLAHAVKEAFQSQNLPWEYSTSGAHFLAKKDIAKEDAPLSHKTASEVDTARKSPESQTDTNLTEVTNQILDMLEGMALDREYVKACVGHYKCDLNATVDAILSGSVPMDISHSVTPTPIEHPVKLAEDAKLPLASSWPPTPVQSSLPRYSEKAVAHTAPGTVIEKIYYGKRDLYEETEEETICDETRLVTIARVQQMYDDEYDDTYDELERESGVLHLNDKEDLVASELKAMAQEDERKKEKYPVTTPSHSHSEGPRQGGRPTLAASPGSVSQITRGRDGPITRNVQKEVERREEASVDERAPGRSNDPWIRQMEDNYAAQVARRPPQASPSTPSVGDARTRANKEKNKAHAGNHNRKDRGQWKRNQGMM